jgi:flavin reductase (DIM6/NTAB) family NADH-FMN oxidoreductase RutF
MQSAPDRRPATIARTTVLKKSLPLSKACALIEPGPVVLPTTAYALQANVMAMSWHSIMVPKCVSFVLQVLMAWVDPLTKNPRTVDHRRYGRFMVAGETIKLRSRMR